MERLLGLDIGDARIGVAISDPLGLTAQPLCTVKQQGFDTIRRLIELVKEHSVKMVIVGLPYEMDGSLGEQGKKTTAFTDRFEKALAVENLPTPVQIILVDERFSSQQAQRVITGTKLKNREKSAAIDQISAALILESYLAGYQFGSET